jgi:hypothetical protein
MCCKRRPGVTSCLSIFRVCGGWACLLMPDLSGFLHAVRYVRVVIVDIYKYAANHYPSQGNQMLCHHASC